jgi:hypothetical protein
MLSLLRRRGACKSDRSDHLASFSYEHIVEPEKFRAAIAVWRQERQLWIDTEVADWSTSTPRLSLLQVRTATGPNVVVDVLEGPMRQVLYEKFIPQIMANEQVEKWAHYAPYERRFLGENRVANLNYTLEMSSRPSAG